MHWQNLINVALNFNQVHSTATTTTWHYLHAKLTCDRRTEGGVMGSTGNSSGNGNGWLVAVDRWRSLTNMTRHVCNAFFTLFPSSSHTVRYYKNLHFLQYMYTHTYTHTHTVTHVVPARFIMSIEIANCDFSWGEIDSGIPSQIHVKSVGNARLHCWPF